MLPFSEGAIIRIKLENFLTYDCVEIKTGARLNVIIGPNGTGKSSIVCAICLGLGGKTNILGRQKDIGEFIKHGKQRAYIEIELFNSDGDNYEIGRVLNRDNTSKWTVNRRASTHKSIEELVRRLNIQVNNLCQFLPQDKVAEFAKMSPQELLENTQKAAGGIEMYKHHEQLKQSRERGRHLELDFKQTKESMEQNVVKNNRLEKDVKNYQKRERHLARIDLLKKKRKWMEYETKRVQYTKEKQVLDEQREKIRAVNKEDGPLRKKYEQNKEQMKGLEETKKARTDESKEAARQAASRQKDIDKQTDDIIELDQELDQIRVQEQRRRGKLRELSEQLGTLQAELDELKDTDVKPALDKNQHQMRLVNKQMSDIAQRTEGITDELKQTNDEIKCLQRELAQLQDVHNRRLEVLRRVNRDTYNAVLWLKDNEDKFKDTIHQPIMTTINVTNEAHIKFIETHVSVNDLRAFVCENQDDIHTFLRLVRDQQRLAVNAIAMPTQSAASFKPPQPIEHFRQHGFYSYLREMVTCPEPVMRYLCRQWHFHSIPVGTEQTKRNAETVIQQCPQLVCFYTENHQYNIKKSKYGGGISSRVSEVRNPSLLTVSYDTSREEKVRAALKECQGRMQQREQERRELQGQQQQLDRELATLREQRRQLQDQVGQRRSLTNRIHMKQQTINRLDSEAVDLDAQEARFNEKVRRICTKKCRLLREQMVHTEACQRANTTKVHLCIRQAVLASVRIAMDAQMHARNVEAERLERMFEEQKERVKRMKDEARQLLQTANSTADTKALSDIQKQVFDALPSTIEDIDAMIHEEQARVDCNSQTDHSVVDEYKQREQIIAELFDKLKHYENQMNQHQQNMDTVRQQWLEPLKKLIDTINEKFSYFFECLQCAGEVDLFVPDNPEDYEKYGVRIKVKFRASEQLHELKAAYQSGGEKSVSTVLYMMALQQLTSCPFRCVDEINQGMDPNNERRVFELMVQTACCENTSQYFLLTPKLLPNLEYSNKMTVLCIFNGAQMVDWDLKRFLKRRHKLSKKQH